MAEQQILTAERRGRVTALSRAGDGAAEKGETALTEDQTLEGLCRGEPSALDWAVTRYTSYVASVIYHVVGAYAVPADVEELTSDVFVALWRNPERVRAGKLRPWLGAVARNKARDFLRSQRLELPLEDDVLFLDANPLEAGAEQGELRQAVRKAVFSMEQPDREIFVRHYYYLQPLRLVAEQMGMPESTVKTRLRRGRMALKERLTQGGFADGIPNQ